ncbi:IS5/IS1182 family transposase, partial [Schleiferilactobacillus harbinensis]|uniref:transposase n=1 Tax=Schleiferilactobacillus harbinensis TaxID=304207 RepID=UPI0021A40244
MLMREVHHPTSKYAKLYDILIPPEHELRRILELVDFSFVYDELAAKYCPDFGRVAIDPIQMFKYVFLKARYNLSDRDLVERARTDMAFKFFLGLAPEDDVIHPSLLSKFRRQRLQDANLLNILLSKAFQIGIAQGVLESDTIIVDATHTLARFNQKKPVDALRESAKKLRKSIHQGAPAVAAEFPEKNAEYDLEAEKEYTQKLLDVVRRHPQLAKTGAIAEALHATEELTEDVQEYQDFSRDEDARVGHKTADSAFFGYKQHIAETEDGLISAVVVTSGEQGDGPYLPELVRQSAANGVEVREVIGDRAYSGKKNIQFADEHDFL